MANTKKKTATTTTRTRTNRDEAIQDVANWINTDVPAQNRQKAMDKLQELMVEKRDLKEGEKKPAYKYTPAQIISKLTTQFIKTTAPTMDDKLKNLDFTVKM